MPPEIDKIQPLPPAPAGKSRAAPRIPIRKRNPGPETGCNSNAQYAALGLRACADAGIQFEPVLLKRAEAWWEQSQKEDGGWCYGGKEPYHAGHPSYGAMSVGGAGSLAILKYLQAGPTWKRDRPSEKAVAWMAAKFDPARHPGAHEHGLEDMAYYYYLYGLERACTFFGTEKLGARDWYAEGARALLDAQGALGNWGEGPASIPDTCFAILFLRRATRPLKPVASVDERK